MQAEHCCDRGRVIYVLTLYLFLSLNRFDRTLGGLEMELRLREHLAKLFNEQRKGQKAKDVRENPRAMAKLLREANRLKTILSANVDHVAQVPTWDLLESRLVAPVHGGGGPFIPPRVLFCSLEFHLLLLCSLEFHLLLLREQT